MSFKDKAKAFGSAAALVGDALLDAPAVTRIREIDKEIAELNEERKKLSDGLINPRHLTHGTQ